MEAFLKHVMIENAGIYTLVGSKPITEFAIIPIIDEKEKQELYNAQTDLFKKHISFEKFKPTKEDGKKLWRDWKKVENEYLGEQFRFVEDANWKGGIFINIRAVLMILDKYYEDFSKVTGQSFEPDKAVYWVGDHSQSFWRKVQKNHYLMGLLFGFGEKNAKLFQQESKKMAWFPLRRGTDSPIGSGKGAYDLTIEDLEIPHFIVFQPIDEQEEKYKNERDKCIQLYRDQDFFELTVGYLKGQQSKKEQKELSAEAKELLRQHWNYNSNL
ncbi:MAG: hypothetical protein K1000chlam2_00760 [Chlamydiae bacterium]|nr:hypothetical protein [Chlamydiota bacterium]